MRSPAGAEVFARLVGRADAVFANFKPGTLAALGFPYEKLRSLNPRIVLAESSAFGDTGPWSVRMGYGPLVRASTGVTGLWTSEEAEQAGDRHPFFDATTMFPDHVVGRITAIGALAGLIHRERTGDGARIHISQAEAGINQLDTLFVTRSAAGRASRTGGTRHRLHGVYPCLGEDEWCVISLRSDADRGAAAEVIGAPGRLGSGGRSTRTPDEAAELCSAPGWRPRR